MATTPKTNTVLEQVHDLIQESRYREALDLVIRSGQHSASMENARGVCLLRLGEIDKAGQVFHGLVFPTGSVCANPNAPLLHRTNYVTAMFLGGNLVAGLATLNQITDRQHPVVVKLREALAAWKQGLGLFQKLGCLLNAYPHKPVHLDFAPGDLG